jgi:hypothetical protein
MALRPYAIRDESLINPLPKKHDPTQTNNPNTTIIPPVISSSEDCGKTSIFESQIRTQIPTSIKIPMTYSEDKKRRRGRDTFVVNLFGTTSITLAIRGFHRWSNRTQSRKSAQTDCTSTNSKVGTTLLGWKRSCKCTHQSSDTLSNQSLHPRLPSPGIQNEQASPMARRRRPRTL